MSVMRKKIAEHMVLSKQTSAHVYTVFEVDFTRRRSSAQARRPTTSGAASSSRSRRSSSRRRSTALRASPDPQRLDRRRQRRLQAGRSTSASPSRSTTGLIVPVIKRRRRDEPARPVAAPINDLADRARDQEAQPRRRAGRHLHHHQPRHLRRPVRPADHQPAAGRDPRRRRHREARRWSSTT